MKYPWKTKGIVLTAPLSRHLDDLIDFIEQYLAVHGCNLLVLQVRYRYQFRSRPECQGFDPLTREDVKRLLAVCRRHGIRLVPKMNLFGHQSGLPNTPTDGILHAHGDNDTADIRDGLLRAYPELDEEVGKATVDFARSLCPNHPLTKIILFDLIDELLDVFEADAIHVGCDEAMKLGLCPTCAGKSAATLFGDWITTLHDHIQQRGATMMMWGDRLLSRAETGYSEYDAAENGTEAAIHTIPKDILVCDWHYDMRDSYPSVGIYGKAGFRIMVSPWHEQEAAAKFLAQAAADDTGHVEGLLMTTWCGSGDLARHMLHGEPGQWLHTEAIARNIRRLFEDTSEGTP